ncbi:MAG: allophanate hydrolase, partial [Burkholderiales bacterium]
MIEIIEPGPQTTVQDLGRFGQLRYGIPPSGPMDRHAFILANRLAGNEDGAAALECTLIGPRFRVHAECAIAVTGAEKTLTI